MTEKKPATRRPAKKTTSSSSSPVGTPQLLPGMDTDAGRVQGSTLKAIIAQLEEWKKGERLTLEHIALGQLAIALATSIDTMLSTGKVSMLSNNAHELRETLVAIAGSDDGEGVDAKIRKLMEDLAAV